MTNLYDLLKFFGKTTAVICLGAGNKPTINYYIFLQIFKIWFYRLWSFSHWKNDRVDKKGALDNFFTFGLGIWNKKSLDLIWFNFTSFNLSFYSTAQYNGNFTTLSNKEFMKKTNLLDCCCSNWFMAGFWTFVAWNGFGGLCSKGLRAEKKLKNVK